MNTARTLVIVVVGLISLPLVPSVSSGQSAVEDRSEIQDLVEVKAASLETSGALMALIGKVELSDQASEDQVRSAMLTAATMLTLIESINSSDSSARDLYRKAVRLLAGARRAAMQSELRAGTNSPSAPRTRMTEQMAKDVESIEVNLDRLDRYFSSK